MGGMTTLLRRTSAIAVVAFAAVALAGCSKEKEKGCPGKKAPQAQSESMPADASRTDPKKQKVEPAKPLPQKQLFAIMDVNDDGVIDEVELRAAYTCKPGTFCDCDKQLVKALYEYRAEFGHVLKQVTSSNRPVDGKLSSGESTVSLPSAIALKATDYGYSLKEFERFMKSRMKPGTN